MMRRSSLSLPFTRACCCPEHLSVVVCFACCFRRMQIESQLKLEAAERECKRLEAEVLQKDEAIRAWSTTVGTAETALAEEKGKVQT